MDKRSILTKIPGLPGLCPAVLEYCSAVWCPAADTHLKLQDRAVSGARFLTGSVFECDIAHRRSVAVLCMLYKIRCNPMHPLKGDGSVINKSFLLFILEKNDINKTCFDINFF